MNLKKIDSDYLIFFIKNVHAIILYGGALNY